MILILGGCSYSLRRVTTFCIQLFLVAFSPADPDPHTKDVCAIAMCRWWFGGRKFRWRR